MFEWLRRLFGPVSGRAEERDSFYSSIAGVSHQNRDRTSRQTIIREALWLGAPRRIVAEDDNPVDTNALALLAPDGRQVGYVNSRLARDMRKWLAEGCRIELSVSDLTGGTPDKPTRGVNVLVRVFDPRP
jgi:HIRAN domain-containing protein